MRLFYSRFPTPFDTPSSSHPSHHSTPFSELNERAYVDNTQATVIKEKRDTMLQQQRNRNRTRYKSKSSEQQKHKTKMCYLNVPHREQRRAWETRNDTIRYTILGDTWEWNLPWIEKLFAHLSDLLFADFAAVVVVVSPNRQLGARQCQQQQQQL